RLDNPAGIAVDSNGNIYLADWGYDLIRKISPNGSVTILAGNGKPGSADGTGATASFYLPGGIAVDASGYVYVSDTYNNRIRKISPAGVVSTLAGKSAKGSADGKGAAASFSHPAGITVEKNGNLYVADVGNNRIRMISPGGEVTTFAGTGVRGAKNGPAGAATFYRPFGVSCDEAGDIYVADYQNNLIRKISP
ncbi:MAG TPA: SBBP repeat-containing protein, partial [Puia sp.]|nr:SBBP repeat-containing protein [Puia sp.]